MTDPGMEGRARAWMAANTGGYCPADHPATAVCSDCRRRDASLTALLTSVRSEERARAAGIARKSGLELGCTVGGKRECHEAIAAAIEKGE